MENQLYKLHAQVELTHWWFVARRNLMCRLLSRVLPPSPQRWVVDVGCGTGANIAALADLYRVTGTDTEPQAIDLARQRFGGVDFRLGAAPAVLGGEKPDAMLLMDVLEHVEHDRQLLTNLIANLAPGGLLLLTVPADMRLWSPHDTHFGHYRRYDREALAQLWRDQPVRQRLLSSCNYRLYPAIRAARAMGRLRGKGIGQGGSDLSLPPRPINRLLRRVFEGESATVERAIDQPRRAVRRPGVSLVAILQRIDEVAA